MLFNKLGREVYGWTWTYVRGVLIGGILALCVIWYRIVKGEV